MQTVARQILQCPYRGIAKRLYLEGQALELMGMLVAQEIEIRNGTIPPHSFKLNVGDRIHHARDILLRRLNNPPNLAELARQVGLNECTLKRGFRQLVQQHSVTCETTARVEVVKYYVAYLQAQQAVKIAVHQMQTVKQSDAPTGQLPQQIATHRLQPTPQVTNNLDNQEYVTAATEMLTANTQARVALEELAACVGLSAQETLAVLKEGERK